MARGYGGWAPYVPVDKRRRMAEREVQKLRKRGHTVAPVHIEGRAIARTFWGKAWCDNLESYSHYENRLPRGRTYVRNGSVIDLRIAPRTVEALVSGSSIYTVSIAIKGVPQAHWQAICRDCAGGIESLVELLQGRFSKGVMERLCRQDKGLFPSPSDIRFSCTCPDMALMCKHVAAVLYGVGARLDAQPELLFRLRAVDEADLVSGLDQALPFSTAPPAAGKVLDCDDVSALFGLDMAAGTEAPAADDAAVPAAAAKPASRNTRASPGGAGGGGRKKSAAPSAGPDPGDAAAPAPAPAKAKARAKARAKATGKADPAASASRKPERKAAPGTPKGSGRARASKSGMELTPDGFVKWWK